MPPVASDPTDAPSRTPVADPDRTSAAAAGGWQGSRRPLHLVGWIVALALLVSGVVLLSTGTFTSTAVVHLDPISLDALLVTDQTPPGREEAFASEIQRVSAPGFRSLVQDQLAFPLTYRVTAGEDDTLRMTTTADSPADALEAAQRLAATYVADRQGGVAVQAATQGTADELTRLGVVPPETGPVPPGTPDEVAAQITALQARLRSQQGALSRILAGDTAVITQEPGLAPGSAAVPLALLLAGVVLTIGLVIATLDPGRRVAARATDDDAGAGTGATVSSEAPVGAWAALGRRIGERAGLPVSVAALASLAILVIARAALYAAFGVGFVNDDWLIRANLDRFGLFGTTTGLALSARALPVAWTVYNLVFGLAGDHPLVLLLIGTALNVAAAALLYLVIDRIFTSRVALWVTAVWVLVPNHSSLTVWASTVQARAGLILMLGGLLFLLRGRGWIGAAACFVAAAFSYELTVPVSMLAAVFLPSAGRLTWRQRAPIVGLLAAAALWLRAHPHYPLELHVRNPIFLWSGHFGGGLLGGVGSPLQLRLALGAVVLIAALVCAGLWVRGDRRWDGGPAIAVTGLVVMAMGLATINATGAAPDGAETGSVDRLFTVSSIGSAFLLVGIGLTLHERRRRLARAGAAGLVVTCLIGTVISARTWAEASDGAAEVVGALGSASEDPSNTDFVIVPGNQWHRGVTGQSSWSLTAAQMQEYGEGRGSSLLVDDHPQPVTPDEVVIDWADVLGHDPPQPSPGPALRPEWQDAESALEQTMCAAIVLVTGTGC